MIRSNEWEKEGRKREREKMKGKEMYQIARAVRMHVLMK